MKNLLALTLTILITSCGSSSSSNKDDKTKNGNDNNNNQQAQEHPACKGLAKYDSLFKAKSWVQLHSSSKANFFSFELISLGRAKFTHGCKISGIDQEGRKSVEVGVSVNGNQITFDGHGKVVIPVGTEGAECSHPGLPMINAFYQFAGSCVKMTAMGRTLYFQGQD